jgi:hypothetical protein
MFVFPLPNHHNLSVEQPPALVGRYLLEYVFLGFDLCGSNFHHLLGFDFGFAVWLWLPILRVGEGVLDGASEQEKARTRTWKK